MLISIPKAAAPIGVQAIAKPKFIRIKAHKTDGEDGSTYDPWFREFVLIEYPTATDAANKTNGEEIDRFPNPKYDYTAELSRGTKWFRVGYYDIYNHLSELSAVATCTYRGAVEDDVEDDAVSDRKRKRRDPSNMVRNPDMDDVGLWTGSAGLVSIPSSIAAESTHRLEIAAAEGLTNISTLTDLPVKGGKKYYLEATLFSPDGITISAQMQVNWYSDLAGTAFISNTGLGNVNLTTTYEYFGILTAPPGARRARMIAYKNGGANSKFSIAGAVFRRATDKDLLADGAVTDSKFDPTPPGVVTGLSVTHGSLEYDDDKKVQAYGKATWVAPVGGVEVAKYRVKVRQTSNNEVQRFTTDGPDLEYVFPVKTGRAYTVEVAAISKSGVRGDFVVSASYTRAKKAVNLPTPVIASITTGKKKITADWTDVNEQTYPDFDITYVWSNTTGAVPDPMTTPPWKKTRSGQITRHGIANNTTYRFWIAHRDKAGNFSALSNMMSGQSTGDEVTSFADLTGQAGESQIADDAVSDRKRKTRDGSNMLRNPECDDLTLWEANVPLFSNPSSLYGSERYLVAESRTEETMIRSGRGGEADIPVRKNKKYYVAGYIGTFTGGANVTCQLIIQWYSMDAAGVRTLISQTPLGSYTGAGHGFVEGIAQAPPTARRARLVAYKGPSAVAANSILIEPDVHLATDKELLADGSVSDEKTDQTAPAVPVVALAGFGADYDEDGTLDAGLTVSITNPNTGVPIKRYALEIQRANASGGPWSDWRERPLEAKPTPAEDPTNGSLTTTYSFPANKRKWYRARVRAVAFAGKKGNFSGYTGAMQPTKHTGYTGLAAPQVDVPVAIANGYNISWSLGSLDPALYKETEVTIAGIVQPRVVGLSMVDMTPRAIGATPNIWVRHFDKIGGVTNVSPGRNAPAFRAATAGEVGVLGGDNLGLGIVTNEKTDLGDTTNMLDDPNCRFPALWSAAAGLSVSSIPTGYVSESSHRIQTSNSPNSINIGNKKPVPVRGGMPYRVRIFAGPSTGVAANMAVQVNWYSDAEGTTLITNVGLGTGFTTSTPVERAETLFAPAGARSARIIVYKFTGADTGITFYGPSFRYAVTAVDTDPTALTAPTGLSMSLLYQDIDGDGTIDTTFKAAFNAVTGAGHYEVEFSRSDTSDGTYSVVDVVTSPTPFASTKVLFGKYYKARVRAFSAFNVPGAWSGLTAAMTPSKKGNPWGAVSYPSYQVIATPGGNLVVWTKPTNADYAYTEIWRAENSTDPNAAVFHDIAYGNTYLDARSNGDWGNSTWAYYIRHRDTSGNLGPIGVYNSQIVRGVASVNQLNIEWGSIATKAEANSAGNTSFGTGNITVQSVSVDTFIHVGASYDTPVTVILIGMFRNRSGNKRTFGIDITRTGGAGIVGQTEADVADGDMCTFVTLDHTTPNAGPSVTSEYNLRLSTGQSGNIVSNRRLVAVCLKR